MDETLILDRYRPLRDLGGGGFATVVLAWDTRMQRRVAIKRLPLPLDAKGRPHRQVGLAEARTSAMLNHPAIVAVLDFDTDSDEAFIVMEYVDGASLAELLAASDGPLTLDETAAVVESVADALSYAHDNGVLHLDVKPENILVARDGRIKVTDFGIAELSSLSGHGPAFGGTLGYMPLEQLEGRNVSVRTDEWAFAALVYELLTGTNPFAADSIADAATRMQVFGPPAPSDCAPELDEELDEVLLHALSTHPRDRFDDVASFADELMPLLGDPEHGRASLSELVKGLKDEASEEAPLDLAHVGLWDRLGGRLGSTLVRALATVQAGWLAWTGLSPLALDRPALMAGAALIALAAALAPSLGVGLGLCCLVAGLAATGSWPAAVALATGGGLWWWWLARRSPGSAVLPLAAPALASARLGLAQPLLAGFALPPLHAAASALMGGALAFLASAATLGSPPHLWVSPRLAVAPWDTAVTSVAVRQLLTTPSAYVALLAWPAAAAVMSVACSKATRFGAALGAVLGGTVLGGGYVLADELAMRFDPSSALAVHWVNPSLAWSMGGSLILVLAAIALGPPLRPEENGIEPDPYFEDETA